MAVERILCLSNNVSNAYPQSLPSRFGLERLTLGNGIKVGRQGIWLDLQIMVTYSEESQKWDLQGFKSTISAILG